MSSAITYPLPDLSQLAAALARAAPALAVGGVVAGARALPLAALARAGWRPKPLLVVVPHVADVDELAAGLRLLAPALAVATAPAEGAAPYHGGEPPLAARLQTVRVLGQLAENRVDVVVVAARALVMPIPRPWDLAASVLRIERGDRLDTGELAQGLVRLGFRRVDVVEEVGDFALRGWVVDLHPGGTLARRCELDDDRVESIRPFDPATQLSVGDTVDELVVGPLDPFPATPDRLQLVGDALAEEFPSLAALVAAGAERRLWWGALHLGGASSTWLDECAEVVICDRDELLGELGRWYAVQLRDWQALSDRSMALPGPDRLLAPQEQLEERLTGAALRIETLQLSDGESQWWRLATHPMEGFASRIPDLVPMLRARRAQDMVQLLAVASEGEERRFRHLLEEGEVIPVAPPPPPGGVAVVRSEVQDGFVWDGGLAVYGRRRLTAAPRPRARRSGFGAFRSDLRDLKPGDLVVHLDHGIGRFTGFRRVQVEGRALEMMVLSYHGGDTLLVPVERADLIQRYSSAESDSGGPRLDRLGGSTWAKRKARVKKAVREMAAELLRLAAVRQGAEGFAFSPDSPWQREFEDAFEWELTEDQDRAVREIKADMESSRPMDRLLCGDVGYGKTEVAIRAAFKAVLEGKQVAVLAPTTILVGQHLRTFQRRMAGFPMETRMLSRFVAKKDGLQTLEELAEGRVDIIIGTHRLLAADVKFRDLGLVIVDEEQRFGVAQKERLKRLRTEVDVLAMSATPIPRTLNMSFAGLRDISLIETPPRDRQAVETAVLEFSREVVREAVLYEMERGGQVFFVHNRVKSIGALAEWLRREVPEARVVVAHGQMPEGQLEKTMRVFLDGEADVLLATAIIENGLDIPNANTLLVNRADRFGLAQLYQLRGRVGRSDRLAFANFLVPPAQALTATARARLAAIQEFCQLGAGFRIAARDLEIRGAGNLLGAEQHGFMEAVGFETYCQLLEEAVAELEGRPQPVDRQVELKLGLDLQLPERYIPEPQLRLSFYKRLAACVDEEALDRLLAEVVDRYGTAPPQLAALRAAQRLRLVARRAGINQIVRRARQWRLRMTPDAELSARLVELLGGWPGSRVTPVGEIQLPDRPGRDRLEDLQELLEALAAPAA